MKPKKLFFLIVVWSISINTFSAAYFLKDGASGDGLTPFTPNGSITLIYNKVNPLGGDTIVVCGKFGLAANYVGPIHSGQVVITQVYNGIDYRTNEDLSQNYFYDKTTGRRFTFNGPVRFENINFKSGGGSPSYLLFIAKYNPIVMGEGISVEGYAFTGTASGLTIIGGYQDNNISGAVNLNSSIAVESGKFQIIGFNRNDASGKTYTGTVNINISGGVITRILGGCELAGKGGNLNLTISGGTFIGTIYAGHYTDANNRGVVNSIVNINGGDFNLCPGIIGLVTEEGVATGVSSYIDYCSYTDKENITTKVSGFTVVENCTTTNISDALFCAKQTIFINDKAFRLYKEEADVIEIFDSNGRLVYYGTDTNLTLSLNGLCVIRANGFLNKIIL